MDNVLRAGGRLAVGVNVGHDIVTQPVFVLVGTDEVDVVDMAAQFVELFGPDTRRPAVIAEQAEFMFRLGERDPKTSPGRELALRTPQLGHLAAGIAAHERIIVHL